MLKLLMNILLLVLAVFCGINAWAAHVAADAWEHWTFLGKPVSTATASNAQWVLLAGAVVCVAAVVLGGLIDWRTRVISR